MIQVDPTKYKDPKAYWSATVKESDRAAIARDWGNNEKLFRASGIISCSKLLWELDTVTDRANWEKMTILDQGCGTGRITEYLGHCFKEVLGTDFSEEMIEKAKKRCNYLDNVSFLTTSNSGFDGVEDDYYDIVNSYIVFQHCQPEEVVDYFEEVARILKKGGFFLFQLPTALETIERPLKHAGSRWWNIVEVSDLALTNHFDIIKLTLNKNDYHILRK